MKLIKQTVISFYGHSTSCCVHREENKWLKPHEKFCQKELGKSESGNIGEADFRKVITKQMCLENGPDCEYM